MTEPHDSLVKRCSAGDARAWRELVDRYAGYVMAIGRASRLPEDVCEDVAQITFAALARHIASVRDDRAIASWLQTTATRESWKAARRRRREAPADMTDVATDEDPTRLEDVEAHQRLREAMGEMGGRCRDLLRALYYRTDEADYARIASDLGIPVGSIGPTRRRCLEKLARLLSGAEDDAS